MTGSFLRLREVDCQSQAPGPTVYSLRLHDLHPCGSPLQVTSCTDFITSNCRSITTCWKRETATSISLSPGVIIRGLVLSYIDATNLPEGRLAQQYTLCDNFFHSAYGGSFFNHQWLVAAATPLWTAPIPSVGCQATIGKQDSKGQPIDVRRPVRRQHPAAVVGTVCPGTSAANRLLINNTDPSQPDYTPNIGNRLDDAGIEWRWYSGGWDDALANNVTANSELFQFHHQPFAYYTKYAPFLVAPTRLFRRQSTATQSGHDGTELSSAGRTEFLQDVAWGDLPPVSLSSRLVKTTNIQDMQMCSGQQHVAELVTAVQKSKIWKDCVIIITYDENGGRWDHVVPPVRADGWGVGVRVPAIIISPFARHGAIDSTEYETVSILKLIERRFYLAPFLSRDAEFRCQRSHTCVAFRSRLRTSPQ